MKKYIDNKIPKSVSRLILGVILGTILFFVVNALFGANSSVSNFIYYTILVLAIGEAIYRTFLKKNKK